MFCCICPSLWGWALLFCIPQVAPLSVWFLLRYFHVIFKTKMSQMSSFVGTESGRGLCTGIPA